ncbi:MAG: hypothetical protein ACKVW3_15160 [Phycisphaerales bacterium]
MRWRVWFFVGIMAAATARAQDCVPCKADLLLRGVPASAEAALVVVGASRQRQSEAGDALLKLIEDSGQATETIRAWGELARELGWTPAEAFDELLGRRVMLVTRTDLQGRDWAVVSDVSPAAEARLRERLRPSPRRTLGGLIVLSLEGRLELVVSRGESCRVLLAPAEHGGLFEDLAAGLNAPSPPAAVGECDAAVIYRRGDKRAEAGVKFEGDGWQVGVVASAGMVWSGARPEPWTGRIVSAFEPGSLAVAVWEMGVLPEVARWLGAPALPWPLAGEGIGPRMALVVRGNEQRGMQAGAERTPPSQENVSGGGANQIAVTLGVEGTVGALQRESDRAVERMVLSLSRGEWVERAERIDLGLAGDETAVRGFKLGEDVEICTTLTPDLSARFGSEPVLSWCVRPMGRRGWWVGRLGPVGTVRDDAAVFARMDGGEARPRLTMGVIRPAALWAALGREGAVKHVRTLRWDAWVRDDGKIEGFVRVTMRP